MKVLHITNAYPFQEYESFGIFIKEQIDSLQRLKIQTDVIFINARKLGPKEYLTSRYRISKKIKEFSPDIIHCHHEFSLIPLYFINCNAKIVLSVLGDINNRSYLNKLLFFFLKRMPNKIILKNKEINTKKYCYIPNGVDLDKFSVLTKKQAKEKLDLNRDIDYALFVTATLNNPIKRYDKFTAIIERLKDINIQPLVLSGVTRDLVPYYYSASSILLLTSDHEGSPNAVKEAMACNLPVVSTDVGNVRLLFGDTKGLFISKQASVSDLVKKSRQALHIKKSNGRQRLIDLQLDMQSVSEKLVNLYKELLK